MSVPATHAGGGACEQQPAAADLQCPLGLDDAADVARVALTEVGDHALADRVELAAELLRHLWCHRDGPAADDLGAGLSDSGEFLLDERVADGGFE
jgi:hypothetical protein